MSVKRDRISPGQHNDVHLPKRCSVQNFTVSHDFDCGIFSSSDFLNCLAPLGPQMTKRFCRIAIVVIFGVSFGYSAPVLKFANLYERMTKFNSGNSSRYITLLYCHFDDKRESSVMVPYFGTLLFLTFINIIATSGLYIPVTRAIYRTLLTSNVQGKEHGNKPATSHKAEQTATQETSRKQKARKKNQCHVSGDYYCVRSFVHDVASHTDPHFRKSYVFDRIPTQHILLLSTLQFA